jgi:hypothetical protein
VSEAARQSKRPSVEDTLAIHDLYARYSWALDTGDTDAYVQLYAPDAVVLETRPEGVREAHGHDGGRDLVLRFHDDPAFPGRQHRTSQLVILPDPEDRPDRWLIRAYVRPRRPRAATRRRSTGVDTPPTSSSRSGRTG